MSENRYVCREDSRGDIYIHDGSEGFNLDIEKACEVLNRQNDLLNSQAETIEVLREWIQEIGRQTSLIEFQWHIIRNKFTQYSEREVSKSKRRIAALEGK